MADAGRLATARTAHASAAATGVRPLPAWAWAAVALSLLAAVSVLARPLFPVDETRYLSVAWEMWLGGDFLVPHLNGQPYDHKPPLLFWLIHGGWTLFGVNPAWPRLIGPLCAGLSLLALGRLAGRLWPAADGAGGWLPRVLLAMPYFAIYLTGVMFDLLLLATVAGAWLALESALRRGRVRDWLAFGLAMGLGLLAKGPVAYVYALPPLLLAPWWFTGPRPPVRLRWAGAAVLLSLALPLLWLLAANRDGLEPYLQRLLLDQTLDRIRGATGHPRPPYWYLPFLLLLPMPWLAWRRTWQPLRAACRRESRGFRFVLAAGLVPLLVLSLIGGKQVHYLIPVLAVLSMWLAGALAASGDEAFKARARRLSNAMLVATLLLFGAAQPVLWARYDLTPTADRVAAAQAQGRPVVYVGRYQGEFGFLGRLRSPLASVRPSAASDWVAGHPAGLVVVRDKRLANLDELPAPVLSQTYKTGRMLVFRSQDLAAARFVDGTR